MRMKMNRGYTLVEILVVAVLVILMMGGALVALTGFSERKGVSEDARLVADHLRGVRVKVTAVEVPDSCVNGVADYTVTFGAKTINSVVNCSGGGSVPLPEVKIKNSDFVGSLTLVFLAGSGTIGATREVLVCGFDRGYKVEVAANGIVGQPVSDDSVCP